MSRSRDFYNAVYVHAIDRQYGNGGESVDHRRKVAAIAGFLMVAAVDAANVRLDTCVYEIDGSGSGIAEMAETFRFTPDDIEWGCLPTIKSQE